MKEKNPTLSIDKKAYDKLIELRDAFRNDGRSLSINFIASELIINGKMRI